LGHWVQHCHWVCHCTQAPVLLAVIITEGLQVLNMPQRCIMAVNTTVMAEHAAAALLQD
jgi:hypothetical protein